MAQFKFWNDVNSLLNVDGPLTKGPAPRWERKKGSCASSNSSMKSISSSMANSSTRTPSKHSEGSKTPSKTPRMKSKTPTPSKSKTPTADRFIPLRSACNFELAHYKLNQDENLSDSPTQRELQKVMCDNLHGGDISKQKILSYQKKAPSAPEGFQNPMRVIYTQSKTPASVKNSTRYIPQAPDRILDAPDIVDDYYLNLVDWNSNNILAAALGAHVYLWDAGTGNIEQLLELEGGNDYICSLAWIQDGDTLAIGTTTGTVELWNTTIRKRLRVMEGHSARVGSLSWNSYVCSSGCRSGQIIHHDVRQRDHVISTLSGHNQEVCGLKWSTDGKYLASGGNDNVLNIWQAQQANPISESQALYSFTAHQAAVKALAWCPWQPHILASGGGTADRHIRFWNCYNGIPLNAIDTKSQVCSLLWSTNYKEIISGHGFANNELIIWKYPNMNKVAELTGHTARVLHLAMSPDGTTVLSAGADETLRLWKCFTKTIVKAKEVTKRAQPSALKQCIR
ncbi:unnamed protein product [Brassicogethes aeneus]|uniref:CDC20/Fizzy WD40 domain-containing protein n=1 Tax=Brassicogethes aeneus TaxID=1431903 RepID=A0A9P0B1U9_BRAAE|nr:unnamed protein product [Brassicogethes aeneus]